MMINFVLNLSSHEIGPYKGSYITTLTKCPFSYTRC